jgi:hypothetical protein
MPERYFDKFPTISYANTVAVNITERAKVLNSTYASPMNYEQYVLQNNERPDNIANRYYQDPYMSWLFYLANQVIDPYYDWHIDDSTFLTFLEKKYGSLANATSKIQYYRNNWYFSPDAISIAQYNLLSPVLQNYYQPVTQNNVYATEPIAYARKQLDWTRNTNSIVSYQVNGSNFISDEIVIVNIDSNTIGQGQVCFANSSTLAIQHVSGFTSNLTSTNSSYIYGTESGANVAFTTPGSNTGQVLYSAISNEESSYWSPVYYFDIEQERNEYNKTILVLNSSYSSQIASELENILT